MSKMRLWVRGTYRMCLRQVLGILSSIIAFAVAFYGILTINLKLATNRFFRWLPLVLAYNKRKIALHKLMTLDVDITSDSERFNNISHLRGILSQSDIGFKELLVILGNKVDVIPDEIYYEEIEQTIGFNKVTNETRKQVLSSLQYKKGNDIKSVDTDNRAPFEYLNSEIYFRLQEVIASITVIGLVILLLLSIASNFI